MHCSFTSCLPIAFPLLLQVAAFFVVTTIVAVAYQVCSWRSLRDDNIRILTESTTNCPDSSISPLQFADALAGAAPYLPGVFANKVVDAKERTDLYTDAFTNRE
jgi:hypothetical protein